MANARRIAVVGSILAFMGLAPTMAQVAEAASAPTPWTGEAIELTTSSATLKGSVGPGNEQTSYYFQYGLTTAYGAQTPSTPAGAGTQTIHVSTPVTGLSVYTTYHYRLVVVNAVGTTDGVDRTFTTKKIPLAFTVSATPSQSLFESPFAVSGTLSGTGSASHTIVLQANPFPFLAGFKTLGEPELTDASGSFSFSVHGLTQNTQLRIATLDTPPVYSRVVVERVAVRVTLNLRPTARQGYARLYGTVTPGERGALVSFQLLRRGDKPAAAGSTVIISSNKALSHFSRVVRIRHAGLYRANVDVASGAQASYHSRAILIG